MARKFVINTLLLIVLFSGCKQVYQIDGSLFERQLLSSNDLDKDNSLNKDLSHTLENINCMDSALFRKRLKLSADYHSEDTSEILVIPYSSTNVTSFSSEGFSDVTKRVILLNLNAIRRFTEKNALSGEKSFFSVIELIILHEIGHFRLGKAGSFDKEPNRLDKLGEGTKNDDTQPEYITKQKKIELDADSLAIELVRNGLKRNDGCMDVCFDIELMLPGMQFNMFGNGIPDNWFKGSTQFLHDPSKDYPNMELRVMFMNFFLFPTPERKEQIDDYLYNRTVAPVHQQEFDIKINQGMEKKNF